MSRFAAGRFVSNVVLMIFCASVLTVRSDEECDTDVETMLNSIISPSDVPTIQVQALRRDIIRRLKDALQRQELEDELLQYKRSISSLARWNNLPGKRNLESLARAGYIRTLPNENDTNLKRSIATLAKNGQLPHFRSDEYKRGYQSTDSLLDGVEGNQWSGMRYEVAMNDDKRNIASLAREGMRINGKRNVAALLRRDGYFLGKKDEASDRKVEENDDDKRHIASIKAQYKPKYKRSTEEEPKRQKRDADYFDYSGDEYPAPGYQNLNLFDYEDSIRDLNELYPNAEKRFLGRLPQMGKSKTTPSPKIRFN